MGKGHNRVWWLQHLHRYITIDADAQAFITAAGITDATQKSAINTLVVGLKAASLWTKINALYPIVGGSATSHKFNLKNPLDTDAAFRLSFVGGWTHSSNGALPNGTTGYADTFINPFTLSLQNSLHLAFYSRTQNTSSVADMGCYSGTTYTIQQVVQGASHFTAINQTSFPNYAQATSTKLFIDTRTASSQIYAYHNGVQKLNTTTISVPPPNYSVFIGARSNSGVANSFGNRQCAFASIGNGLVPDDCVALTTLIDTFQTTLGRNV